MQLITSKLLPPLAPAILQRYASIIEHGEGRLELEARYCPAMDLIATFLVMSRTIASDDSTKTHEKGTDNQDAYAEDDDALSVDVWRFNGQQVFAISIEAEGYDTTKIEIIDVSWRHDGKIMAILSSDSIVRLVNSFSGKVAHKFSALSSLPSSLSPKASFNSSQRSRRSLTADANSPAQASATVAYSTHFSSPTSIQRQLQEANVEAGTDLDDLMGLNVDIGRLLRAKADLPQELASIDVEAYLPRLACLPPAGFGAEDLFSTRSSIDSIFHSSQQDLKSGNMDVLMVGREDATVHLRILDSFEIGDVNLSAAVGLPKGMFIHRVICTATNPFSNNIYVLVQGKQGKDPSCTMLLDLDLKFISQSPVALPVLATKATQLNNLLRYLKQIQTSLAREIKTAFELPGRFIRPLDEDIVSQDGEGASFKTVAYHTLATGQVTGVFREWLTDVIGDRNAKRWEKSIQDCLELVRRLISEGWAPAIERSGVVASRLFGLAGCHLEGDGDHLNLGIDKKLVDELQQTINVMAMRGEDLLREVSHELTGFNSFIRWLKWEVEAAALEDTSERLDEMRESSDHSDIPKVLEYIDEGLADPRLKEYIGDINSKMFSYDKSVNFYDHFKAERKKAGAQTKLPSLGELLLQMESQCQKAFEQIAVTLRQGVLAHYVAKVPSMPDVQLFDTKVFCQPEYGSPQFHLLGTTETGNGISYIVMDAPVRRSKTSATSSNVKVMSPDEKCEVLDAKFVDEENFMLLAKIGDKVQIYSHDLLVRRDGSETWQLRHTFDQGIMESGMRPCRLVVNGRKYRRAVAVIDADGKGYSVYDLDSDEPKEGDAMITE